MVRKFKHLSCAIVVICLVLFTTSSMFAQINKNAKYVFYFIGDGMGFSHIALAEGYLATEKGIVGSLPMCFTQFPVMGMATSYSNKNYITCSSAAGTALSTGYKTNNSMLGVNPDTVKLESIAAKIHRAGFLVGITTSVTIDHATPAAFYAHSAKRSDYYGIAKELPVSGYDFFGGGGFEGTKDPRNTKENIYDNVAKNGYTIAYGLDDFKNKKDDAKKMILFQNKGRENEILPTAWTREEKDLKLKDVVQAAIDFLYSSKGFFLMAEGGQIDWGAHANDLATTIFETLDFDQAIQLAYEFYKQHPDETLIVVTADHETGGVTLGNVKGYNFDLSELVNLRKANKAKKQGLNVDNYMSGSSVDSLSLRAKIGWTTSGHTGGAVPVFAVGCGSEMFAGRMDNTDIPKRICKAMGVEFNKYSDHYYSRMGEFNKEQAISKNDIVFVGNSLTQGGDWATLLPDTQKKLAAKEGKIRNRGIIGDTADGIFDRLASITSSQPSKIFLMTGANDISHNISADTIAVRIERIIKQIKKDSPSTKIYMQSLLPIDESFNRYKNLNGKTEEFAKINILLKELSKREKITFIDLYQHFVQKGTQILNKEYTTDGLHLNTKGYEVWAKQLLKYVK